MKHIRHIFLTIKFIVSMAGMMFLVAVATWWRNIFDRGK